MKRTNYHLYWDKSGEKCHGDYTYHGIRFEFKLKRQENDRWPYRGRITAISPYTAKPMTFIVNHPYAESKPARNRVKYKDIRTESASSNQIKKCIHKHVEKIYADNAKSFAYLVGKTVQPDTITPETAGFLYSMDFLCNRWPNNKENTLKQKQKRLIELLGELPYAPMAEIRTNEIQKALKKVSKKDYELLFHFWNYCIQKHYCTGYNPVELPSSQAKTSQAKQDSLHKLTRVPAKNLRIMNEKVLEIHDGPSCGVMLMESGVSAKVACSLCWNDICWPTDKKDYATVKLERPDVVCAVHNYTRPLLPACAMTLFARYEELKYNYSEETLAKMPVVSCKTTPEKSMKPSALVQESKKKLMASGITRNKLFEAKESRGDPVSARILAETYKDLLIRVCGVEEGSGTYKFLLGQAIHNDVSSSNYLSFSDPVGSLRLYKYLCAAVPQKDCEKTYFKDQVDGCDVLHVLPDKSDRCAGMIVDIILEPGEEVVLEAETGIVGRIEADTFEIEPETLPQLPESK